MAEGMSKGLRSQFEAIPVSQKISNWDNLRISKNSHCCHHIVHLTCVNTSVHNNDIIKPPGHCGCYDLLWGGTCLSTARKLADSLQLLVPSEFTSTLIRAEVILFPGTPWSMTEHSWDLAISAQGKTSNGHFFLPNSQHRSAKTLLGMHHCLRLSFPTCLTSPLQVSYWRHNLKVIPSDCASSPFYLSQTSAPLPKTFHISMGNCRPDNPVCSENKSQREKNRKLH